MTISDQITRLNNAKAAIKQSIENKGVEVSDSALLDEYPALIDSIEAGGGSDENNPYQQLYMQRTANETNMVGLFSYAPASTTLDLSKINTSKVNDMSYMFSNCKVLYLDLSGFDVSNVTKMDRMFENCASEINIDGWDTSKLTNANYMFQYFTNNNKYIDLSVLDFSNVIGTTNMFGYCNVDYIDIRNLNLNLSKIDKMPFNNVSGKMLDLSNYDITGLKSTYQLCCFCGCKTIDLTNWKTTEVTDMRNTFYYSTNLEKIIMPDWDMTNVTNTSSFFYSCGNLNYIDLSRSNDTTIAKMATLVPAKTLATYGQMIIPADSSQANINALIAKYWKPIGPRLDMTSCEIVTELDEVKPGKSTKLYYGNPEPWYGNDYSVEYVSSDESVATIDKENMMVVSTGVEGTTEITARIIDTQEVISEPQVFSVSETDNYPNVIKVRFNNSVLNALINVNGKSIIKSAFNYNTVSDIYTYDVGAPITSISMNSGSNFKEYVKLNTSNVTNMSNMFQYCNNLTSLDLSNFDTSNVTNMGNMFYGCNKLTSLDLSNFDTSNVTTMNSMFAGCSSLHTLRLDNCSNATISKIITSAGLPTGTINGTTRKIYCKEANASGLTAPNGWAFDFIE